MCFLKIYLAVACSLNSKEAGCRENISRLVVHVRLHTTFLVVLEKKRRIKDIEWTNFGNRLEVKEERE